MARARGPAPPCTAARRGRSPSPVGREARINLAADVTVKPPPTHRERVTFALFIGVAAGIGCAFSLSRQPELIAHDFSYPWYGAQALLGGRNPYQAVQTAGNALPPFAPGRGEWF